MNSSTPVAISSINLELEELKKENEELKKENDALKKRLEHYEKPKSSEESYPYPLQFNRRKDYWNWMKEVEEEMR